MTRFMGTTARQGRLLFWPVAGGVIAAAFIPSLYLIVVTVAQSWSHALQLVGDDWYFVAAIALGLGLQVGLFVYLRGLRHGHGTALPNVVTGASTGTSTVAMLACCAHHVGELLALLGLSAAAVFLNENRVAFLLLALLGNIVGIAIMVRLLLNHRTPAHEVSLFDHVGITESAGGGRSVTGKIEPKDQFTRTTAERTIHIATRWYPIAAIVMLAALGIWAVSRLPVPNSLTTVIPSDELTPTTRQSGETAQVAQLISPDLASRPYLGISYLPMNVHLAHQYSFDCNWGVLVTAVVEGSLAECAGIRPGDIIDSFDDQLLSPGISLLDILWSEQPEATVSLSGWRDGKHYTTRVELGLR